MISVLGASGRVGSSIVQRLLENKNPVKGVVRNPGKVDGLKKQGAEVAVADASDFPALKAALQDTHTLFVLTPETGRSEDVIGDTKRVLDNCRMAVDDLHIQKVVGLSSMGGQHRVGNLEMSYLLEHAFDGCQAQQVFVRPAYFYSNWLPYLQTVQDQKVLPTFYPVEMKMPMISPRDVGTFIADLMAKEVEGEPIYEVEGPQWYNSMDVAHAFGAILKHEVQVQPIPREEWEHMLEKMGFTADATKNFVAMTDVVVTGGAKPEGKGTIAAQTSTTLERYLTDHIPKKQSDH